MCARTHTHTALEWVGKQIVNCVTCKCVKEGEGDSESAGDKQSKKMQKREQQQRKEDRAYHQLAHNDHESYG